MIPEVRLDVSKKIAQTLCRMVNMRILSCLARVMPYLGLGSRCFVGQTVLSKNCTLGPKMTSQSPLWLLLVLGKSPF